MSHPLAWTLAGILIAFVLVAPLCHGVNWGKFNNNNNFLQAVFGILVFVMLVSWIAIIPLCSQAANPYLTRQQNHNFMWVIAAIVVGNLYVFGILALGDRVRSRVIHENYMRVYEAEQAREQRRIRRTEVRYLEPHYY